MKAKQRVPARRGRATRHFGCQRVGCDRISLRRASLKREIAPNRPGIRGMSANGGQHEKTSSAFFPIAPALGIYEKHVGLEDPRPIFYTPLRETGRKRRRSYDFESKVNLSSRIKKLPHHGIWRALNDLSRELGGLRRHRKAVRDARKYKNAKALKLNVGCDRHFNAGWINIDLSANTDLQLDMREPIPLPNGSAEIIYSEHFFEHLDYPEAARR